MIHLPPARRLWAAPSPGALALLAVLLLACAHACTPADSSPSPDLPDGHGTSSTALHLGLPATRSSDPYDSVLSLDIFAYDGTGAYLYHTSVDPLDLASGRVHLYAPRGAKRNYLLLANFSPGACARLEGRSWSAATAYGGAAVLHPAPTAPIRSGAALLGAHIGASHRSDSTASVVLSHLDYRIDISSLTLDLSACGDEDFRRLALDSDIVLDAVCLINTSAMVLPAKGPLSSFASARPEPLFGGWSAFGDEAFAGIREGYTPGPALSSFDETTTIDGSAQTILLSPNRSDTPHTVALTADPAMRARTVAESGALLHRAGDPLSPVTVQLGATLYGYPHEGDRNGAVDIKCGTSQQTFDPKLVVAVSIAGEQYYYPFLVARPQPGHRYSVPSVSLRGPASPYPNYMPWFYEARLIVSVAPWTVETSPDLPVGYDPGTGHLYDDMD